MRLLSIKIELSLIVMLLVTLLFLPLNLTAQILRETREGPAQNLENLNDADKRLSESFVHDGLSQRTYLEHCNVDETTKKACRGQDIDPKFLGMNATLVSALAQAYTMVIGAGAGGGLKMNPKAPESGATTESGATKSGAKSDTTGQTGKTEQTDKKEKQEDGEDYCKYIAMGTEIITKATQAVAQDHLNSIPVGADTAQKELLYKAARSHGERAKNSKTQFTGWGATTVCYGAMMARPSVSKSAWQNWLKLGAAGFMTFFYKKIADEHEKYENKIRSIADLLPGRGDCNPITQKHCYCSQPETQFDPVNCAAKMHEKKIAEDSYRLTCLDEKLQNDPTCKCHDSNSCYDTALDSQIELLGFPGDAKNAMAPFKAMARGELKKGKLSNSSAGQMAMLKRLLKDSSIHLPAATRTPNKEQREVAKALQEMGMPALLASQLATEPISADAKKNFGRFGGGSSGSGHQNFASYDSNNRNNVIRYGGASGLGTGGGGRRTASNDNPFAKFQKGKGGGNNAKVISYAEKAQKEAQIHKADNRLIFDIISRRYQVSGWKRLDLE